MSSLPALQSKQYSIDIFTHYYMLSGTIEPVGALMAYITNAEKKTLLVKNVAAIAVDPGSNVTSFNVEELWISKNEILAIRFVTPPSASTLPLFAFKDKLRVFLPRLVIQGVFPHGEDTRISDIFDLAPGMLVPATDARIYPLTQTKAQVSRDPSTVLVAKQYVQFFQSA